MSDKTISRRNFVGDVAKAGAMASAFMIVPRHVLGRGFLAPSDKVNVACIGAGGMGASDARGIAGLSDVNVHSLCDVDWRQAESTFLANPKAVKFHDYREMIDRQARNVDAIMVSTPDHSHAAAAMLALKAGKHVYTQKPLTRTIFEARALAQEAARRPKQSTQMGNQGHANDGTRQLRELIEAGAIGGVRRVEFWTNRPIWPQGIWRPTEMHNVPPTLDWDLWLGPAAARPYHPSYAPFNWRGYWDFGTGALGDMACHIMDAAYWTFGHRYPSRITAESTQLFPETAPRASRIVYEFPEREGRPAVTFVWRDGGLTPPAPSDWGDRKWPFDSSGQLWIGDDGSIVAGTYADNPRLTSEKRDAEVKANPPAQKYPRTKGVYAEWIESIKDGTQPGSNFPAYSAPFTELVLLGNLSLRLQRPVDLNPETGEILTAGIPQDWLRPTYRQGWKL